MERDKMITKLTWRNKRSTRLEEIMKEFKLHYKAIIIKIIWHKLKNSKGD